MNQWRTRSLGMLAIVALVVAQSFAGQHTKTQDDSLAAAYEAALYRVERGHRGASAATAWHSDNPANEMGIDFAADSIRVTADEPDDATPSIALRLRSYGYEGHLESPAPAEPVANDNRVEYRRGALREWYVNDSRGLEQGFTLSAAPAASGGGRLMLSMALETALRSRLNSDGSEIEFVDSTDQVRFVYAKLKAWDVKGRELPTRMEAPNGRIILVIDDTGAAYPLTIDPLIFTETKLTANDAAVNDEFGASVAISGDTAVVGAFGKATRTGAAYVFVRSNGAWNQQQKLTAADPAPGDFFGTVAIDGDTAIVGAVGKSSNMGAAYVFVRSGGVWTQQQKLTADDATVGDLFGISVAISGDTAVMGAPNKASSTGATYVFVRNSGVWNQQQKLTPNDAEVFGNFGESVAISSETVVVGTPAKSGGGAAYVFVRSGGVWSQQQKLTASDSSALGYSVAVSADTAITGDLIQRAAYVFVRSGNVWSQQQKLAVDEFDFGKTVAISGNTAVVGADQANGGTGVAYVFVRTGVAWEQEAKLTAGDKVAGDSFGSSVAISGDTVVVGAPDQASNTGAAYAYVDATAADLLISLGEDKTSVRQGDTLTYTITVKNFGPNRAMNTVMNDELSGATVFLAAKANKGVFRAPPTGQTGVVSWYLGELLPTGQEEAQIQVTVMVRGRTTISNTATVKSSTTDPNPVNNTASVTTTVSPGGGKK